MWTVLIVDDNRVARLLLRLLLEAALPEVVLHEATDAVDALVQIEGFQPKLVILDHYMPGMGGFELAEILMKRFPDTKLVMVSADEEARGRASELGLTFCDKPPSAKMIERIVADLKSV